MIVLWIAAVGSVYLFPDLEAALKGVFNRVLNFFPNASVTPSDLLESKPSNVLCSSCRAQRRRRGRPCRRGQARTRDRAV